MILRSPYRSSTAPGQSASPPSAVEAERAQRLPSDEDGEEGEWDAPLRAVRDRDAVARGERPPDERVDEQENRARVTRAEDGEPAEADAEGEAERIEVGAEDGKREGGREDAERERGAEAAPERARDVEIARLVDPAPEDRDA